MLGALGCLTPELLSKYQGVNFPEPVWFRTGASILGSGSIDYLGSPAIIHAQSIVFTLVTQVRLHSFCPANTGESSVLLNLKSIISSLLYLSKK